MSRAWGEGAEIGTVYRVSVADNDRVGNCWMKGRLKDGDLILCKAHSGDCFFDYVLIDDTYSNGWKAILKSEFGAYFLGKPVAKLPRSEFDKLMCGEFVNRKPE